MSDPARPHGAPRPASAPVATPPPQGHPSITLALWAAAWLDGSAAPDDVIGALHDWAPMHLAAAADEAVAPVTGLAWPQDSVGAGPVALLAMLRRLGGELRLQAALPVPGDVTGVVAGTAHAAAALSCGETLVVHRAVADTGACAGCIGLVPFRESGDVLRWAAYDAQCRGAVAHPPPLGETRQVLRESVRSAGAMLGSMSRVGGAGERARAAVAACLEQARRHVLPPGTPQRAAETLDSAATVAAIVRVAADGAAGAPDSAGAAVLQEASLRELADSVRNARVSAAADAVVALHGDAGAAMRGRRRPAGAHRSSPGRTRPR